MSPQFGLKSMRLFNKYFESREKLNFHWVSYPQVEVILISIPERFVSLYIQHVYPSIKVISKVKHYNSKKVFVFKYIYN